VTQTQIKGGTTAKELWQRFEEAGFYLNFEPEQLKFVRSLWQLLARTAQPSGLDEALQLAGAASVDLDWAAGFIEWSAERGDQGEISGFFALSLNDHPHKLDVYGNQVSAWCAQDTLFLVPALGQPAVITSHDPESGHQIIARSDDGARISSVEPDSTVVSIVLAKDEPGNVFEIWSIFCEHIHFFENEDTARAFLSKRDGEFYWLTVAEAMTLGDAFFNSDSPLRRENVDRLDETIDCSLDAESFGERAEEWMSLARGSLLKLRRDGDRVILTFAGEERVEKELRRLAELEAACCSFLAFSISRADGQIQAEITVPKEAAAVLDLFLELPTAV
jgi:hypothetical protein